MMAGEHIPRGRAVPYYFVVGLSSIAGIIYVFTGGGFRGAQEAMTPFPNPKQIYNFLY